MQIKEASKKWNISERRIRKLIQDGRIEGATKIGSTWNMPVDTNKPFDKRFKTKNIEFKIDLRKDFFKEVDTKLNKLNNKIPLSDETLKSLKENNILDLTYNSNAIEGNTLTLRETKVVLEGITIGGKSVKEHLEVINHKEAILFLEELVKEKANISEAHIKNIHSLILKEIDNNAGKYRLNNVKISGATKNPTDYTNVPIEMERLIYKYENWNKYHPLIRAALLHGEFVFIHPFIDGNGRTARLLMNFEAMRSGYLPIIIKANLRARYYDALDKAMVEHDYTEFIKLIVEEENEMLDKYLDLIK